MMIRAATAALLFGTLAVSTGATGVNLRGNNGGGDGDEVARRERILMDMDMLLDFGEMVCKERIPFDGSVVCSFRTVPPTDMITSNVHHDCLRSNDGTNFCLTAEVYRTNFGDVPQQPVQQRPVQQQPVQQQPVQQQPVQQMPVQQVGAVGRCPSAPQATGQACAQYIPMGSRETSCYFGRTQCNCALSDDPTVTEAWNCRLIPNDAYAVPQPDLVQQPKPQPKPQPVVSRPVTNPAVTVVPPPVTNVDAVIQNQVSTVPPVPINEGNILPQFINPAGCPIDHPDDGTSCDWGQSCAYYIMEDGEAVGAVDCNCDGSCEFQCVPSRRPGLASF